MPALPVLSSICSLGLLPVGLAGGETAFYILIIFNFVVFHAIWLVPRFQGERNIAEIFQAEMRLPLVLFAVCGIATLSVLASQGRLS